MKISTLLYHVDHGSFALPCFARDIVWKPSQVPRLFNSLYHGFPLGSVILWTPSTVRKPESGKNANSNEFIVDGQQRIAVIYGVVRGRPPGFLDAKQGQPNPLRFHIENEVFQFYRTGMKNDPRWINLTDLFNDSQTGPGKILDRLYQTPTGPERIGEYAQRLNQLGGILDRNLHVEYLPSDASPEEAAEIYLVANGKDTSA